MTGDTPSGTLSEWERDPIQCQIGQHSSKGKVHAVIHLERMSAGPNSSASKQLNRILQDQQLKHQQIACLNQLQQGLQRPQSLVSQSVAAYSYLLDGEQCISPIVCRELHRPRSDRSQLCMQKFF